MIGSLLSDVWAYASAAGLIVGLVLLPVLIRRSRADAGTDAFAGVDDEPFRKDLPEEPVKVLGKPESAAPRVKAPEEEPKPAFSKTNPNSTTTGGLSPAIVYLQNLKLQIEHFEKEIHQLQSQVVGFVQKHDKQYDDLLARMGNIQEDIHRRVHTHAEAPAEVPKPAPKPQPQPQPQLQPQPQPQPEPAPKAVMKIEPSAPAAVHAPSPVQTMPLETADEDDILKPTGKDPVWPV
jgi:hypothetical protein